MNSTEKIKESLNVIREVLDADVQDVDIEMVVNKALKISQLIGLSAECKAAAKRLLKTANLMALNEIQGENLGYNLTVKKMEAMCPEETELFEYADRINAACGHCLDTLRSVISLRKQEMANEFKSV